MAEGVNPGSLGLKLHMFKMEQQEGGNSDQATYLTKARYASLDPSKELCSDQKKVSVDVAKKLFKTLGQLNENLIHINSQQEQKKQEFEEKLECAEKEVIDLKDQLRKLKEEKVDFEKKELEGKLECAEKEVTDLKEQLQKSSAQIEAQKGFWGSTSNLTSWTFSNITWGLGLLCRIPMHIFESFAFVGGRIEAGGRWVFSFARSEA